MQVKRAGTDNLDELLRIARSTFVAAFRHLNDPAVFDDYLDRQMSREALRKQLENPGSRFFIFTIDDGMAIGYTKLNTGQAQTEDLDDRHLEIERIYLAPEHQGKGLGREMMTHAVSLAKQEGFEILWLGVWQQKLDSIAFYKRMGFEKFGEHEFMMGDEPQMDDLMLLRLSEP